MRAECPHCGSLNVTRVFLTPFGISKGSAKRTDAILQHQFDKMGIANFSNAPGPGHANKVTWKPKGRGERFDSGGQPWITPSYGMNGLAQIGLNPGGLIATKDLPDGSIGQVPLSIPSDIGAGVQLGARVGGPPTALYKNTNVVGGIDSDGRNVFRTK